MVGAWTAVKEKERSLASLGKCIWPLTNVVYLTRTFHGLVKYDSHQGTTGAMLLVVQILPVRTLGGWMG